jgi:hypothetical protein
MPPELKWKKILLEGDVAVLSDTAPTDVDFSAASAGVGTTASRYDHKHDVPEASVGDLAAVDGGAAAIGSANKFVRADHKHALGPLVADLNFAEYEADALALQNLQATDGIVTAKLGRIYFDKSSDRHPYVYVG